MCSTVNTALPFSFSCEGSVNSKRLHGGVSMSAAHRFNASGRFWPNYSSQQSDMDLTWQEIMAITELQEFDVPNESSFEALPYPSMEPVVHYGNFGMTLAEPNHPTCQASPAASFEGSYIDAILPCQRLNTHLDYGHSGGQATSILPNVPPLQPPIMNLFNPMSLSTTRGPVKGCSGHPEDLESDSGLSLGSSPSLSSPENAVHGQTPGLPQDCSRGYTDSNTECTGDQCQSRPSLPCMEYSHTFNSYPGNSYFPNLSHASQSQQHIKPGVPQDFHGNNSNTSTAIPFQPTYSKIRGGGASGPLTRDERRALALQIPFPLEKIVNLPVDDFNELLSRHALSEPQLALVRDIRRRGKNKVAAQNCRKRKLDNIVHLEHELGQLKARREHLAKERLEFQQNLTLLKCHLSELYLKVFSKLRDEEGQPYSLEDYSLQQTHDGNVYLVQRNASQD